MGFTVSVASETKTSESLARKLALSAALPLTACAALAAAHAFGSSSTCTPFQRALGALLGIAAVVAAWRYWRFQLFHRLPIAEFALLEMYVFFGMHTITDSMQRGPAVGSGEITAALVACLLFVASSLVASGAGGWVGRAVRPHLARWLPADLGAGSRALLPLWIGTVALANTGAIWMLPSALRYPVTVMADVSGLLVFVAMRPKTNSAQATHRELLLVAAIIGAAGFVSGMLEQVLRPLAVAMVLVLLLYRRLPLAWLTTGLVLFVLFNPAKHVFRANQQWAAFDKERLELTKDQLLVDPIRAAESWQDALEASWSGNADTSRNTRTTMDRLNYLSGVARTIDYTGSRVPFDNGSRWWLIVESFIPRLISPNKPLMTREFNDRYNYLFGLQTAYGARRTTVALPIIADGYWNFGWPGVVLLSIFAGFYWGLVANLWQRDHWGLCWLSLALFRDCVASSFYGYVGGLPATVAGVAGAAWVLVLLVSLVPERRSPARLAS
jgi:hypothetical protein